MHDGERGGQDRQLPIQKTGPFRLPPNLFAPTTGGSVLELCEASPLPIRTTVVMSQAARARLLGGHKVDESKLHVIPHGAHAFSRDAEAARSGKRPTIVTWGLDGPGKGLEWGIQAMALLRHLDPLTRLVIGRETHPTVKRREGESYRDQLDGVDPDPASRRHGADGRWIPLHFGAWFAASVVASRVGHRMSWSTVGLAYEKLAGHVFASRMSGVA